MTTTINSEGSAARDEQFVRNANAINRESGGRAAQQARRSVLWVDDRPENNIYEQEALMRYGVDSVQATSTADAIRKLASVTFDAVISDMDRPPDSRAGYTLLRALRSEGNQTPFFVYSGSRAPKHVAEARREGAQGATSIPSELISMVLQGLGVGD